MTGPDYSAHAIAIGLAPRRLRPALAALWALDMRLGGIVASTSEPIIGQMRLTWWHDALVRLDTGAAPLEPVLQSIARDVLPRGVPGATLAVMTDGWEAIVVVERLDEAVLADYAAARGGVLFAAAAQLCGLRDERADTAGKGWALADLAVKTADRTTADTACAMAKRYLDRAGDEAWPRRLRPLGALALLADLSIRPEHSRHTPLRDFAEFFRFRLTGRR